MYMGVRTISLPVSRQQLAHPVDVNLSTVEAVKAILEKSPIPVSRNWLLDQLKKAGRTTVRQRLNRVLDFFFELDLAVEGTKGIQWTHSGSLQRALVVGRRL